MRFQFIADEHVKVQNLSEKHEVSKGYLPRLSFEVVIFESTGIHRTLPICLDIGDGVSLIFRQKKVSRHWSN